jgi:hypothetical protein
MSLVWMSEYTMAYSRYIITYVPQWSPLLQIRPMVVPLYLSCLYGKYG